MSKPIFEQGRVCIKIAGREAGRHCAVLEVINDNFVMVSGPEVRRRKCNIAHLEPLDEKIDVSSNVNQQLIEKYNIPLKKKKEKHAEKLQQEKPKRTRKTKQKEEGK